MENNAGKLLIEQDSELLTFVSEVLTTQPILRTSTHLCFHCGYPTRYPVIARQSDIDAFSELLKSAYRIMDKHGITANLLADIRADIAISIAKGVE